ncbi:hypothetical protein JET18_00900 [Chryseobacterium sp. L7]|uniref:DUF4943 domain-containing protein n=1 Tax=Chryseobacterium endalhagicum TaxID=2797638 RepID=A0ABS1Q9U9_9FLAO|nr:hypothetical protein [Chryseobacterium endalhagicum]MBL1219380.1 hypothetical protein [Chryseobacterium endalhagicum]
MKAKIFIALFIFLLFTFCKSQTSEPVSLTQYPNLYSETISKINNIIPTKSSYYGQPLSVFLQALAQQNLIIKAYDPGPYNNKFLKLMFINDSESSTKIWRNFYVEPHIEITFQQPFDFQQASTILNQYHWFWNSNSENFYKDLIIAKIEFWYVSGISDRDAPPK